MLDQRLVMAESIDRIETGDVVDVLGAINILQTLDSDGTLAGLPLSLNRESEKSVRDKYEKGSGLGLSTAKRIVERHDGWTSIESKPVDGTRVTVIVPKRA